jgi:membrane-associated phospholipid phosphatase
MSIPGPRRYKCTTLAVVMAIATAPWMSRAAAADSPTPTPDPDAHQVHWDPGWSHSNAWDYSVAGVSAASLIVEGLVLQPMRPPLRWSSPILFDSDVRGALRLSSANARSTVENVAWALWGIQVAYPVLVDVPFAWARYDYALARDLFWQDAVTLTLAGAVDLGLRDLVGRARPGVYDCLAQGGSNCLGNPETTRSFPGGHTVNSTAASVLTCTQHLYTRLYGGPWDGFACVTTVASDLTLAALRILSDNHWATDQIAGLAIGSLIGWGVPYVMHFHGHAGGLTDDRTPTAPSNAPAAMVVPMPLALDHGAGLGVSGLF